VLSGRSAGTVRKDVGNTTIYNRFNRWANKERWRAIFEALAKPSKGSAVALEDFRRTATRYDKLAEDFLAAVHLAAAVAYWLN